MVRVVSAAEAAYRGTGPQQRFRYALVLHLTFTCGEDGSTSASPSFSGPPELVDIDAVLLDTGGK
eukprot:SAG31_NODE_25480_length_460_cov_1.146814_2_plen_64_part_01